MGLSFLMILPSCSDQDDEITNINYDRLFSPTELKLQIANRTSIVVMWNAVKDADSYVIEVFNGSSNFEGTPILTFKDIVKNGTLTDPFMIQGLDGEADYSVQIKAVGTSIPDSKWASGTIKTNPEQIFLPIDPEELDATEVTLRWPAGQEVTEIILTPGDITHPITADEKAAGAVTFTDLTGETSYTATLKNGIKTRGTLVFTTLIDLGGAIPVEPEDDFSAILSNAQPGDAFALYPGTYGVSEKFVVKANVQIKAVKPNDKPILKGYISIEDGASLLLKEVILDGINTESNQALIFNTTGVTYGALTVEGCEIRNHDKGLYYLNVASIVESITINNCLIYDIPCNGGDLLDSRLGAIKTITLSNSTVYNSCAARDFIRYDDKASNFPGISPVINVMNNTLVGVANDLARRILYIRFAGNSINFSNNLVTNTVGYFSKEKNTAVPVFDKNNYFEAPALLPGGSSVSTIFDDKGTNANPQFKDPANGDFTVQSIVVNAGDPRWLP